jgi:5-(carboxyamino)imidazole ribonucleotide synthase
LKTRRFGYDGKGQLRLNGDSDFDAIASQLHDQAWIYEGLVDFACEVSVILARGLDGQVRPFDVTRNVHLNGILHTATVPSAIGVDLQNEALQAAGIIAHALDHIGVLGVEFFVGRDGKLSINEIAPRVHNSGHWTQDGCNVCQFQQHMRAVAGWPLGDPARHADKIQMTNLIGDDALAWESLAAEPQAFLHLYGKREVRAGRKMGHVNRLLAQIG